MEKDRSFCKNCYYESSKKYYSKWLFLQFQMYNFTIDSALKSETKSSTSILRLYKQKMMLNFLEIKPKEPKLEQKQVVKELGFSDSTIKRYR